MLPAFLLPDSVLRENGSGPAVELDMSRAKPLLLTLGITRIIEQQSLEVAIMGSPDGQTWQRLLAFPQKFYCGTYALYLDLSTRPEVLLLRAEWKMNRWGRGDPIPLFGFYLFAEEMQVHSAVA